jgi:hypothetical protein
MQYAVCVRAALTVIVPRRHQILATFTRANDLDRHVASVGHPVEVGLFFGTRERAFDDRNPRDDPHLLRPAHPIRLSGVCDLGQ